MYIYIYIYICTNRFCPHSHFCNPSIILCLWTETLNRQEGMFFNESLKSKCNAGKYRLQNDIEMCSRNGTNAVISWHFGVFNTTSVAPWMFMQSIYIYISNISGTFGSIDSLPKINEDKDRWYDVLKLRLQSKIKNSKQFYGRVVLIISSCQVNITYSI